MQTRVVSFVCLVVFMVVPMRGRAEEGGLSDAELRILQIYEGVMQLFEQYPEQVWKGYDLREMPLIVYLPDKWALLSGTDEEVEGFTPYPKDWPPLRYLPRVRTGTYPGLAGQLAFDFAIGSKRGIAVGLPDDPSIIPPELKDMSFEALCLGYVVHEAFHQYQSVEFGRIPWGREEEYPILDIENSSLVCLEMRLLVEAVRAAEADVKQKCEELLRSFVAVRLHRWQQANPALVEFERGLELREGTAKYVENRAVALAGRLKYDSGIPLDRALPAKLAGLTEESLLIADFDDRFSEGGIAPRDVARNRIYPVGSAQCYLLDYLAIDWQEAAERAGDDYVAVNLLKRHLKIEDTHIEALVEKAKQQYEFAKIVAATKRQIDSYNGGYREAMQAFESQRGTRFEFRISMVGRVERSRVSAGTKWAADGGRQSLCEKYRTYVLSSKDLRLQVKRTGVLETDDWDKKTRSAVCYASGDAAIAIDGETVSLDDEVKRDFSRLTVRAGNVEFECSVPGAIGRHGNRITVDIQER